MAFQPPEYVPEDMWEVVFYRVPFKSLGVCRCVCKTWHRIITSPYFVKTHLDLMITLQNKCILYQSDHTSCTILPGSRSIFDATLKHSKFYDMRSILHDYTRGPRFHGICNGLVCVSASNYEIGDTIYLWNPTCRRIKKLPEVDKSIKDEIGFTWKACVSFGYYDDDCKVFVIAPVAELAYDIVSVYNLSTNTWNFTRTNNNWTTIHAQVDYDIYVNTKVESYCVKETKFVDGTVYVIEVDHVRCFDLSTETIRVISFPREFSRYIRGVCRVTYGKTEVYRLPREFDYNNGFTSEAYADTIAIFGTRSASLTMWILRDKSFFSPVWVVNKQQGLGFLKNGFLVGFLNDGQFLIGLTGSRELYSCKLDNPKLSGAIHSDYIDGRIHSDYMESLLLLDEDNLDPIDLYSIDELGGF